jgi:hypothetical protein
VADIVVINVDAALVRTMAMPAAAFVATGLTTTVLWHEPMNAGLVVWQAIVLRPLAAILLIGPCLLVRAVQRPTLRVIGVAIVCVAAVVASLVVASSDDAQAGIAFLDVPILGGLGAAAVFAADRAMRTSATRPSTSSK